MECVLCQHSLERPAYISPGNTSVTSLRDAAIDFQGADCTPSAEPGVAYVVVDDVQDTHNQF